MILPRAFRVKTGRWLLAAVLLAFMAWHGDAAAQSINISMGDGTGSSTSRIVQLILLLTVLSIAPGILIMVTSFARIVIVFGILRNAMGTGTSPPNMIITSMAMFMTIFIMSPTFEKAWTDGISPLLEEAITEEQAFERTAEPFKEFMLKNVREKDLGLMIELADLPQDTRAADAPLRVLIPAFMISELHRAFEIGFLIYLPFVIIDMVIASVLMSMGMMMLPPMMLALPFKLIFFVLIDGWYLLVGSLVRSFNQ
jgi:flagellar biosynthetic protein FliP